MSNKEPDDLDRMIDDFKETVPGFAEAWTPKQLALELAMLRKASGLTQQDVADRMGLPRPRIADIERNPASVSFGRIVSYAHALGATFQIAESPAAVDQPHSSRATRVTTYAPTAGAPVPIVRETAKGRPSIKPVKPRRYGAGPIILSLFMLTAAEQLQPVRSHRVSLTDSTRKGEVGRAEVLNTNGHIPDRTWSSRCLDDKFNRDNYQGRLRHPWCSETDRRHS